jgi:hypothetical protein
VRRTRKAHECGSSLIRIHLRQYSDFSSRSWDLAGSVDVQTERRTHVMRLFVRISIKTRDCVFPINNTNDVNLQEFTYCPPPINCPAHVPCLLTSPKLALVQSASLPYFSERYKVQFSNIYSYTEPRNSAEICAWQEVKWQAVGREKSKLVSVIKHNTNHIHTSESHRTLVDKSVLKQWTSLLTHLICF